MCTPLPCISEPPAREGTPLLCPHPLNKQARSGRRWSLPLGVPAASSGCQPQFICRLSRKCSPLPRGRPAGGRMQVSCPHPFPPGSGVPSDTGWAAGSGTGGGRRLRGQPGPPRLYCTGNRATSVPTATRVEDRAHGLRLQTGRPWARCSPLGASVSPPVRRG